MLIRLRTLQLHEVLPLIHDTPSPVQEFGSAFGHYFKVNSIRLVTFKTKGLNCVVCGAEGVFFAVERSSGSKMERPHLNLYATVGGKDRLMTHDHTIPLSRGGPDSIENSQTMCEKCNSKKGKMTMEEFVAARMGCANTHSPEP